MAITIPPGARQTFEKVLGAMGGEDYSYYLFDVTKIAEKPTLKVQVGLRVYVPLSERETAVYNVKNSLDGDDIETSIKDDKQLDVSIEGADKGQVIRLIFKDESSKGSGGGAAATKIQEAAQCVYAAIRYYCGDVKVITDDDLKCGAKYTNAPGVRLEEIEALPKEWKDSSWEGAKEIFDKVGDGKFIFVRGDKMVEKEISEAFKRVKNQTNLSSEDKWNPADIWMVKAGMRRKIAAKLKKENTIDCLNNYIQQSRADGDLIGISLKKIEGSPTMKLLNADYVSYTHLTLPTILLL